MKRIRAAIPRVRVQRVSEARAGISLLDAIADPALFRPWFQKDWASWAAWFAFIAAAFCLPMTKEQLAIYRKHTRRHDPPSSIGKAIWLVCGRRSGKSFILALIGVYLACFHSYAQFLAPGERAVIMIIAADRKQARVILRYVSALLTKVPLLARMIQRTWAEGFDLNNSISIEVSTSSFRSVRGYAIAAALCDEAAFWSSDDSAEPDFEVINALRPGMSTIATSMLLVASSPYARRGILWNAYRQFFAKEDAPELVWQAATREMNATIPQSYIDSEYERDPASASAEFGGNFRSDIEQFVSREIVEACTSHGIHERPPESGIRYVGFVDPSGGSADSFTLAIAHRGEAGKAIIDCVREIRPKFSPDDVCSEFAATLKSYGIHNITGDRYAGVWPVERFRAHQITYEQAARPKSELYQNLLPVLNSGQIELLDNPRVTAQLVSLERRTSRAGRDHIDHPPGPNSHDDLINSVAGVVAALSVRKWNYDSSLNWVSNEEDDKNWQMSRLIQHMQTPSLWGGNRGRRY
jgi:hypothetical protein